VHGSGEQWRRRAMPVGWSKAVETWINRSKVEQQSQEAAAHTTEKGTGEGKLGFNPIAATPLYPDA
jgi:hypothetical protein